MSIASNLWQRLGGAPDPRTDREIMGDIEAELAFHLEQRERELVAQGVASELARAQALRRFGDIELVRAECRRVQLGGRIMLQRVTLVVLVILLAAVAWLSMLYFNSRRAAVAEIGSLKAQISQLRGAVHTPEEAGEALKSIMEEFTRSRIQRLEAPTSETRVIFDEF